MTNDSDHSRRSDELEAMPQGAGRFDAAIRKRRFEPPLEQDFREFSWKQNLPRARAATSIYLGLVLIVTLINAAGLQAPMPDNVELTIQMLRLGIACPALAIILLASFVRSWRPYYQCIVGAAVIALGSSVMGISGIASAIGFPQFQMGDVLVIVYSGLFLGLLYRTVLVTVIALLTAFPLISLAMGANPADLGFAGAVLVATAWMVTSSAGRVERLARATFIETRLLNEMAERDGLTGLYNRRKFDSQIGTLWQQAYREHQNLQILLMDIDRFKRYNDLYGHQAGDECIRRVSRIIARAARRPMDFCARYGGEEFVLVCYGAVPGEPLERIAEQLREQVMAEGIRHENSDVADVVTVSIGSAVGNPHGERGLKGLIQKADEALYRAKQSGRNRVVHKGLSDRSADAARPFSIPLTG